MHTFVDSCLVGFWLSAEGLESCGRFGRAARQNHRRATISLTLPSDNFRACAERLSKLRIR
jgi:hypothetical protein